MLVGCGSATAVDRVLPPPLGVAREVSFDHHLLVDQFGYLPAEEKVAVIRSPVDGYDRLDSFSPGNEYQLRRSADGSVAFAGQPKAWNGGAVDPSAGDRGWWFDFSAVTEPGSYFVFDVQRGVRSAPFRIDARVYAPVLRAAVRTFYYQRSGMAKRPPHAEACWSDEPAYIGRGQDREARDVTDRRNRSKQRDLSGGWFDAGDTGKYVTFAATPVHQLLTAYQQSPAAFTDDFGLPESGNGIPDLIDEIKWEVDWLQKMQEPAGGVALKVGGLEFAEASPPSSDRSERYYVPSCTSSTVAAAGMFAHAAWVYRSFPGLRDESTRLTKSARRAWRHYRAAGQLQTDCDSGAIKGGDADWSVEQQKEAAVTAAVYLFAVTGDDEYDKYLAAHLTDAKPYRDAGWSRYNPEGGDALMFYATLPDANPELRARLLSDRQHDVEANGKIYGFNADDDLYRSFLHGDQYHWGSNRLRAAYGNTNADLVNSTTDAATAAGYRTRALSTLHYFHGVNPFAMVYLSNAYDLGATRAVNEIYHLWYARGSQWSNALSSRCGPPPGYVPGGPNANAGRDGVPEKFSPPTGQPPQKSYRDWNVGYPENSWAVSEPAIYYQSGYVKLLAQFVQ